MRIFTTWRASWAGRGKGQKHTFMARVWWMMALTVCTCTSSLFQPVRLSVSPTGLLAGLDDFEGSAVEEADTSAESDEDYYDEWTGFGRRSEVDEDPTSPPVKPQETPAATPAPQPESKYIPPHLRKVAAGAQGQPSESLVRLTKQLKGFLNRYATRLLPTPLTLTKFPV